MLMLKFLVIFVLSVGIHAQTLLTETFSSFLGFEHSKASHYWIIDSLYAQSLDTTLRTDWVGDKALPNSGFYKTRMSGNNPLYVGGDVLTTTAIFNNFNPPDMSGNIYGIKVVLKPTTTVVAASSAMHLLAVGQFQGFVLGANSAAISNELITVGDVTPAGRSYWASATDSISSQSWSIVVAQWDGAKYQIWINGVEKTTSTGGTPALAVEDGFFNLLARGENGNQYLGSIAEIKLYDQQLTDQDVKEETFCAPGWASLSGGVIRADSAAGWMFHQGIMADTVYFATALTAGSWSIAINVDGAAGGESLQILTSSDASAWDVAGSITTTTIARDTTVVVSGLGYLGFGLSAGVVYIDNIEVTLIADPAGVRYSALNRYIGQY